MTAGKTDAPHAPVRTPPLVNMTVKIAPSILSADFTRLGDAVRDAEAAGVDRVQVDIMDGRFVPNITFGPLTVRALRPLTRLTLEVHLMVTPPDDFIDAFAEAGADTLIVHQEATPHLHRSIQRIHGHGKKAGVAINPSTPAAVLSEVLASLQLVLVMTVNPGFGGQKFIPETLRKLRELRRTFTELGLDCELEVDGGIHEQTAPLVVAAGANVLVAGSAVFGVPGGVKNAVEQLLQVAAGSRDSGSAM
jgi:ribulose-phosphate 3-epimerase